MAFFRIIDNKPKMIEAIIICNSWWQLSLIYAIGVVTGYAIYYLIEVIQLKKEYNEDED